MLPGKRILSSIIGSHDHEPRQSFGAPGHADVRFETRVSPNETFVSVGTVPPFFFAVCSSFLTVTGWHAFR